MEVSKLTSELKFVEANGCTLNIDERSHLMLALATLQSDLATEQPFFFWGKVRGKPVATQFNLFRHYPRLLHLLPPAGFDSREPCAGQEVLLVLLN